MLVPALRHLIRGFAMGSADIVPGVSGGTIALVLGIYERLIASTRAGSRALIRLLRADVAGFRHWMGVVDWAFVMPLLAGIGLALVTLARLIGDLLQHEPEMMAAIFMGLVAGSVVVAWRLMRAPRVMHGLIVIAVGLVAFAFLGLVRGTTEDAVGQVTQPALWAFFGAGAIAICAMILPGVSGSFLLVVMGMYGPALTALTELDLPALVAFGLGAVIGLALFSQVLHLALQRQHDLIMAVLIGLMAGSVRVLWPWPDGVASTDLGPPGGDWLRALVVAAAAFALVVVVGRYAQALEIADERELEASAGAADPARQRAPGEVNTPGSWGRA